MATQEGLSMSRRTVFGSSVALAATAAAGTVGATPEIELEVGTPVRLEGTPHLYIFGEDHRLHWAGDTRALLGKRVLWSKEEEWPYRVLVRRGIIQKWTARAHEVKDHSYWRTHEGQIALGDPWLSAGLLKDGDPIYLVKWEHDWERPKLLHIQSIRDVEIFGINAENYGRFVLDKPTWEARYGLSADSLVREPLQAATWGYWQGFPRGIGRRPEGENPDWPGIALYGTIIRPGYRGNALVLFACKRGEDRWAAAVPFPGHVHDEPSRGLPYVYYPGLEAPQLWRGGNNWDGGWNLIRLASFTDTSEQPWVTTCCSTPPWRVVVGRTTGW